MRFSSCGAIPGPVSAMLIRTALIVSSSARSARTVPGATPAAGVDRIEQDIGQGTGECVVISGNPMEAMDRRAVGVSSTREWLLLRRTAPALRHRSLRGGPQESVANCAKLRAMRSSRSVSDGEYIYRFHQLWPHVTAQSRDRETDRRQGIFELVRHLPRTFAEGTQPLGLDGTLPSEVEGDGRRAHALPKDFELRCPSARRRIGERIAATDQLCPRDKLIDRAAELPTQVSSHARRTEGDGGERHQRDDDDDFGSVLDEIVPDVGPALTRHVTPARVCGTPRVGSA